MTLSQLSLLGGSVTASTFEATFSRRSLIDSATNSEMLLYRPDVSTSFLTSAINSSLMLIVAHSGI